MPVDASIPLAVKQIQSPLEAYSNALGLSNNLMQAEGMRMKLDQARQDQVRQNKLAALLSQGADEDGLRKAGFLQESMNIGKDKREMRKTDAETEVKRLEAARKKIDLAGQVLGFVMQSPTPENAIGALDYLASNGIYSPEEVNKYKQMIAQDPLQIRALAEQGYRSAMSVKDQLPKYETRNLGGTTDTLSIDPVTGRTRQVNSAINTQSPDSMASVAAKIRGDNMADSRARERLDLDRGVAVSEAGGPNQVALTKQFGKAPPGYRWKQSGELESIPGGPQDIKAGEQGMKAAKGREALISQSENVLQSIRDAKKLVGYNTAGFGGLAAKVPMTDARDLQAKLETIKANLGFDRLQQMRDMSPTGGALGQVAVQELTALQSTVASLDQLQSPPEVKKALQKIENHYNRWSQTLKKESGQSPQQTTATPSVKPPSGPTVSNW